MSGPTASISAKIEKGPEGTTTPTVHLVDGAVVPSGAADAEELTLRIDHDQLVSIGDGDVTASVGFMQGWCKLDGDAGTVIAVLKWWDGAGREVLAAGFALG